MDDQTSRSRAGHRFEDCWTAVPAGVQRRCLEAAEVDPEPYGDAVDVTLLGNECFRAMIQAGISIDGHVHLAQRFRQWAPARLGEPLRIRWHVAAEGEHPRGQTLHLVFDFHRADGALLVRSEIHRLRPDPGMMTGARRDGPAPPPAADAADGFERLAGKQLTPERVTAYSGYVGNLIHFDPAFAARYGFRAPVAQGLMSTTYVTGLLCRNGAPETLDLSVRFLRPLFWDEAATLAGRPGDGLPLRTLRCLKADGRIAAEATVAPLETESG